jgi:tetratricopeptide (TPR) repeat protein
MKRFLLVALLLLPSMVMGQVSAKEGVVMTQIRVQVFLSNGSPAGEGIQVQLSPSAGGISKEGMTDKQGKYVFEGLSPTRYTVRAHMAGFADAQQDFDMSIMSSAYATLTLRSVAGTAANVPPAGVVSVLPSDMPEAAKNEFNSGYTIITSGKDFGKAVPHFRKVVEAYPKYAPAYMLLGTAYAESGKDNDAIAPLKKAIELDPKLGDSYTVLGKVYNQQKKYPEAEQSLTKAVELTPTSYDAQYELGRALFFQQKATEAQPHAEAALKANPNSAPAHILMGNIMLRERNAEGALKEYQEALRLDPKGPMAGPTKEMVDKIQNALKASAKK